MELLGLDDSVKGIFEMRKLIELLDSDSVGGDLDASSRDCTIHALMSTSDDSLLEEFAASTAVGRLEKWLAASHAAATHDETQKLLTLLGHLPISVKALMSSGVGKTVNKTRKSEDVAVQTAAVDLLRAWKALADQKPGSAKAAAVAKRPATAVAGEGEAKRAKAAVTVSNDEDMGMDAALSGGLRKSSIKPDGLRAKRRPVQQLEPSAVHPRRAAYASDAPTGLQVDVPTRGPSPTPPSPTVTTPTSASPHTALPVAASAPAARRPVSSKRVSWRSAEELVEMREYLVEDNGGAASSWTDLLQAERERDRMAMQSRLGDASDPWAIGISEAVPAPAPAHEAQPPAAAAPEPKLKPYVAPKLEPYVAPKLEPYVAPKLEPYVAPKLEPYVAPKLEPYVAPKLEPYVAPKLEPYVAPALEPYEAPALEPYEAPALQPYQAPSVAQAPPRPAKPQVEPTIAWRTPDVLDDRYWPVIKGDESTEREVQRQRRLTRPEVCFRRIVDLKGEPAPPPPEPASGVPPVEIPLDRPVETPVAPVAPPQPPQPPPPPPRPPPPPQQQQQRQPAPAAAAPAVDARHHDSRHHGAPGMDGMGGGGAPSNLFQQQQMMMMQRLGGGMGGCMSGGPGPSMAGGYGGGMGGGGMGGAFHGGGGGMACGGMGGGGGGGGGLTEKLMMKMQQQQSANNVSPGHSGREWSHPRPPYSQ